MLLFFFKDMFLEGGSGDAKKKKKTVLTRAMMDQSR